MRNAAFAALALLSALPAGAGFAAPVTRICEYRGPGNLGPLTVTVDEAIKEIRIRTAEGVTWTLQDGVTTNFRPDDAPDGDYDLETQFVAFKPDRVEVGIRDPEDGSTIHMSYFNRSALRTPPARCIWKSLWEFRRG